MADEITPKDQPTPPQPEKPAAKTDSAVPSPPPVEGKPQTPAGNENVGQPTPPAKPAAPPAAAAKPAAPAAPAKPAGPTPQPWESDTVTTLKRQFGSGIKEAVAYVGQPYMVVDSTIAHEVLQLLRDDEQFDYLVDCTAVHYPKREQQFDMVWILYSFPRNERIRVKTMIKEGEPVATVSDIWETANWLEREVFDMFGIQFNGHPDLKRILLPEGWKGFPLRKDYGILQQDTEWVQINLGIESGQ
jgi:NADH-quinone oxidoreductase subunit C